MVNKKQKKAFSLCGIVRGVRALSIGLLFAISIFFFPIGSTTSAAQQDNWGIQKCRYFRKRENGLLKGLEIE